MDLAQIRNKAKKKKEDAAGTSGLPDALPTVTGTDHGPAVMEPERELVGEEEDSLPVEEQFLGAEDAVGDELPEFTAPQPVKAGSSPMTASAATFSGEPGTGSARAKVPYDPVALILAGRDSIEALDSGSSTVDSDETEVREFLCFRIAREEYAINIMEIKEIIKPRDVTEVPRSPVFIPGVISLRGMILPVFDIAVRLGFVKDLCTGKERIVVVRKGDGFCGILVDEVSQVVRLAEGALEPPPPVLDGIDKDFVSGIGRYGERMLILLNMDKVLDINVR